MWLLFDDDSDICEILAGFEVLPGLSSLVPDFLEHLTSENLQLVSLLMRRIFDYESVTHPILFYAGEDASMHPDCSCSQS
jgi:hypothetical protein